MQLVISIAVLALVSRSVVAQDNATTAITTTAIATTETTEASTEIPTPVPGSNCNVSEAFQNTKQLGSIMRKIMNGIPSHEQVRMLQCTEGCLIDAAYKEQGILLKLLFNIFYGRIPGCENILTEHNHVEYCELTKCVFHFFYQKPQPTSMTTSTTTTTTTTTAAPAAAPTAAPTAPPITMPNLMKAGGNLLNNIFGG